jgi:hypothetical protein
MGSWGMPSPRFALKGRNSDSGVTNTTTYLASDSLASVAMPYRRTRRALIEDSSQFDAEPLWRFSLFAASR